MFIKMRNLLLLAVATVLLNSCSEYQKALKSEEVKVKYDMAQKLYNEGDYKRANRLFEQVLPKFVGKPQGERVVFFLADSYYKLEDYLLSGYQFERFSKSYPKSEKALEAAFLGAKSYYMISPKYSIDQTETHKAIQKLQSFINTYPDSEYTDEVNNMVKELTTKLEKKHFEIAKQFHSLTDYKAAISAFNNFISDYPGTPFREDAMFYRLDAAYTLAVNSIFTKMEERLSDAKTYYDTFKRYYPESKYDKDVAKIAASIDEELKQFAN